MDVDSQADPSTANGDAESSTGVPSGEFTFDPEANQSAEEKAERRKEEGTTAYKAKQYTEAVAKYSEAIDLLPTFSAAIFNRAAAYMAQKRYQLALVDCQSVLALQGKPPQAKTLARLGKVQLGLGQVEAANASLTQARELLTSGNAGTAAETAPTLKAVQADFFKLERLRNHLNSIARERENKSHGMVAYGIDAASKEVEEVPMQWKIWRLESMIGRKMYEEATYYAT